VPDTSKVIVADIAPDSPALSSGMKAGDQILSINGLTVDAMETMQTIIKSNLGQPVEIIVLRDGVEVVLTATPRVNPLKPGRVGGRHDQSIQ